MRICVDVVTFPQFNVTPESIVHAHTNTSKMRYHIRPHSVRSGSHSTKAGTVVHFVADGCNAYESSPAA